jgi:iron complex outermembrane receptor protein
MPNQRLHRIIAACPGAPGCTGSLPAHRGAALRNPPRSRRAGLAALALAGLGLMLGAGHAFAQTQEPLPPASVLKKMSLDELTNLEVESVSKHPEKLSETASAIQVITQEEIRRSGVTSIPEALRLASNLQVAQVDARQWAITARGFNSTTADKLLVMIDGRSVYTPLYSGVFWDVQDLMLEDVDRIEVISGPGGTVWGANAVNGVINIITKNAKETPGWLLSGGGGGAIRDFAAVHYGGRLGGQGFYRIYLKHFDRDGSRLPGGRDGGDDWRMTQGGFRADWTARGGNAFTLQGDAYAGSIDQLNAPKVQVDGGNLVGRWTKNLSDVSSLKLQIYYDHTHREIPGLFREDLDVVDLDFQHRFPLGSRQDIVWGLDFRQSDDHVGNSAVLAFLPPDLTTRLYSGFIQDEITLVKNRLKLTLGTKLEHNDFSGFEYQPSGRLALRLGDRQMLWAAVSRAVRTPSRIDRDFHIPPLPGLPGGLAGGPGFVSEKLIAYELGYRIQPSGNLSISAAAFRNDYDDLRSLEPKAPAVFATGFKGETYGAELTTTWQAAPRWRLRAGYTWLEMRLRAKPGSADTASQRQAGDSPRHQFQLRSSVDLGDKLQWDTTARYVDGLPHQRIPAYWAVDLNLAWLPCKDLELALAGQNLLDGGHPEFGTPASRREIRRGVHGKLTWRF